MLDDPLKTSSLDRVTATQKPFQLSMPNQRKQFFFTLVVIKTQLLLQILNGDDLLFFRMADSTMLENKGPYKPMLYQFCIANNAVETRFGPLSCLK